MKIIVGSKNKVKVDAVREALAEYPRFAKVEIIETDVPSGVSDQPASLEETVRGATNRAKAAFENCDYAVGLESGLMHVPGTRTGYMDVCVAAIYDGKETHFGLSSAWELPDRAMTDLLVKKGMNLTDALNTLGFVDNPNIGREEGALGFFTEGRLTRKDYTKQALHMALIHIK